jgi:hypothetical protein
MSKELGLEKLVVLEWLGDNFGRHKRGAWWCMRLFLKGEKAPYGSIREDERFLSSSKIKKKV